MKSPERSNEHPPFETLPRRGQARIHQWSGPPSSFRDRAARKSFWAGRDRSDSLGFDLKLTPRTGLASAVGRGSENWHFTARACLEVGRFCASYGRCIVEGQTDGLAGLLFWRNSSVEHNSC